jgi:succinate-semialdehyde dehydrogenase/glutarate-semialdehyde dehydrogenase
MFTNTTPDPSSGKVIGSVPEFDKADTQKAIDAAAAAFPSFKAKTGRERSKLLRKWYDLMVRGELLQWIQRTRH